ncbi:MAG: HD-GYP domain-containing protein [Negativicutes bacterium]
MVLVDDKIFRFIDEPGIFNHLYQIERKESYLYHHSLDVAIISGILARWLELPNQDVNDVVLAGLLHDIGKVLVPSGILDKPGKLTPEEQEAIMLHSSYGSKLIKKLKYISNKVNLAVFQHHERVDGSGYPLKASTEKIYLPAKIIGIADVYGAVTSNRVYKQRISPFDAVGVLEDMMGSLDISICMAFLNNIKDCFIGNNVLLSDRREAKVIYWSKFKHARPIVQTIDGECFSLEKTQVNIVYFLG